MSVTAKNLLAEALRLDEPDRASIAGALIESLHGPPEPGVEEAWDRVIERRVAGLDAGEAKTVPWSEVRARLFDGFE
jgi:putative addiction module component (TIGR02574 family)